MIWVKLKIRIKRIIGKRIKIRASIIFTIVITFVFALLNVLLEAGVSISKDGIELVNGITLLAFLKSLFLSWSLSYATHVITAMAEHQQHVNDIVSCRHKTTYPKIKEHVFIHSILNIIGNMSFVLLLNAYNIQELNFWTFLVTLFGLITVINSIWNMFSLDEELRKESKYKSYKKLLKLK